MDAQIGSSSNGDLGVAVSTNRNTMGTSRRTQRRVINGGSPILRAGKKKILPTQTSSGSGPLSLGNNSTSTKKKKKSVRNSNQRRNYVFVGVLVLFIVAGTVVMSYVSMNNMTSERGLHMMEVHGNGDTTSSHASVRDLLRKRPFGTALGRGGSSAAGSTLKYYDRLQLQKDYEQATSHLPEFPQNYIGVIPSTDYDIHTQFKVLGGNRFEEYIQGNEPYHITEALIEQSNELARHRKKFIKKAMKHAWSGYVKYSFGDDEVLPITHTGSNNWGGMGITMVDSLDTLWLMGMKKEFYKCRDWVRDSLNHDNVGKVSLFETTIRSLGGLLAAYDWSRDQAFLDKAYDLGKRLIKSFDGTPTGIPFGQVDLKNGFASNIGWTGNNAILAEFGTIQVEFRYLAKAMHGQQQTDDFAKKTELVFEILNDVSPRNGLFPYYVVNNPTNTADKNTFGLAPISFANNHLTFGAMADSLYEYMLKIWIQGGQAEPMYREMYDKAIQGMYDELLQTSTPSGLTYIADKSGNALEHKMDHLACFMGGLLALGAYTDPLGLHSDRAQRDLKTARAITYTCYQMYARMGTGISPEFVEFEHNNPNVDFKIGSGAPHYLLRPETFESFFILNFLTGDPVYREWGWECFQAIEKYCKTDIGYGSLGNVDITEGQQPRNKMESFFLAETLKYLYLLQDPDTEVDILNKHVFNTEAHPLRINPVLDTEGFEPKSKM